jgi:hypothetical protein
VRGEGAAFSLFHNCNKVTGRPIYCQHCFKLLKTMADAVRVQAAIRNNAEEARAALKVQGNLFDLHRYFQVSTYMSDLLKWEKEISAKERQLKVASMSICLM